MQSLKKKNPKTRRWNISLKTTS